MRLKSVERIKGVTNGQFRKYWMTVITGSTIERKPLMKYKFIV